MNNMTLKNANFVFFLMIFACSVFVKKFFLAKKIKPLKSQKMKIEMRYMERKI